jgi:hypothetical protein
MASVSENSNVDALRIDLTIKCGSDSVKIPTGSVTNWKVDLTPYGYECRVSFWRAFDHGTDAVFDFFVKPDPVSITFSVQSEDNPGDAEIVPLTLEGLVTDKSVYEVVENSMKSMDIYQRHYELVFKDTGQVLFKQHYPVKLLANSTLKSLLTEAMTIEGITLNFDWPFLDEKRTVALIACSKSKTDLSVSFYDWIFWLADTYNGHVYFDYSDQSYSIKSAKKENAGDAVSLRPADVGKALLRLPEELRHSVELLNCYSESSTGIELLNNERGISGCHWDQLVRIPIEADYSSRKTLETDKQISRGNELEVDFPRFPMKFFHPNEYISFNKEFSSDSCWASETYRVVNVTLKGHACREEAESGKDDKVAAFNFSGSSLVEPEDSTWRRLPCYNKPVHPIFVEGKILSSPGEDVEKTYEIHENAQTSEDSYKVSIPLWDQELSVDFMPDLFSGHFFFPAYKHSRVLISLWFDQGRIERFLDFGARTALPQDSQGNHILFGPKEKNETSLKHVLVDQKPVFSIKRVCESDTELVQIEEGTILFKTAEEE